MLKQKNQTCIQNNKTLCFIVKVGATVENSDCTIARTCQLIDGKAKLVAKTLSPCATNGQCKPVDGHYKCTCKPGFQGDPLAECTEVSKLFNFYYNNTNIHKRTKVEDEPPDYSAFFLILECITLILHIFQKIEMILNNVFFFINIAIILVEYSTISVLPAISKIV